MRKYMPRFSLAVALAVGLALGVLLSGIVDPVALAQVEEPEPVYLVVAGQVIDAEGLEAYAEAAGPGAQAAGIEVLARGDVADLQVLEGAWPYEGFLVVERFRSTDDLLSFWNSPEYQAAIKLREGKVRLDVAVAVPAAVEGE